MEHEYNMFDMKVDGLMHLGVSTTKARMVGKLGAVWSGEAKSVGIYIMLVTTAMTVATDSNGRKWWPRQGETLDRFKTLPAC